MRNPVARVERRALPLMLVAAELLACGLVSGCMTGPDYARPAIDVPDRLRFAEILPIAEEFDHSALLRNQEFAGIVVRKLWLHVEILTALPAFIEETEELVQLIDDELEETM